MRHADFVQYDDFDLPFETGICISYSYLQRQMKSHTVPHGIVITNDQTLNIIFPHNEHCNKQPEHQADGSNDRGSTTVQQVSIKLPLVHIYLHYTRC